MEWLNIPVDSEVRGMTGNTILYADRTFTDENVLPSGNMPRERSLLSDVLAIDSFRGQSQILCNRQKRCK